MSEPQIPNEVNVRPINDEQLLGLLCSIAQEHGIGYVASPEGWESIAHDERSPSIAIPEMDLTQHHKLLPFDLALNGGQGEFASFLLYEVQNCLCDAGFDFADTESPIVITDNGKLSLNRESPIPLSVFLLSADLSLEKLSKLMSPEFYDREAISTVWFARSLSTLQGQPQFSLNNSISLSMG